ncbi:capsular biosynthesis protein [Grimontia sp. SpTr1]|uniref:capsular biosynthesis protein n=1 Tax=Grimontia sp. SpTr1 TaxID=2995319 RepID=UPI00248CC164|nr:capsular biosynthesis protein [Grimontia sp. SpTr1]
MFLIMSAAYVGQEIQSEFGKIPPSFLPLGNRRLFQHQVRLAPEGVAVYLSVPELYKVSRTDMKWLENEGVSIIRTPENLTLGASLVAALNLTEHSLDSNLQVLFGDTLFTQLPAGEDIVCVSQQKDSYNWAVVTSDDMKWLQNQDNCENTPPSVIVNGYFNFRSPKLLIKSITQSNWKFIEGLNKYHSKSKLKSILSDKWLDFGHVNTYYRSKADFTTQRAFNTLKITSDWIEKSSNKKEKIEAEANWFSCIPPSLRGYIPQYLGSKNEHGKVSYRLEYLHQTALNELYVFSELPVSVWDQILNCTIEFIKSCLKESAPENYSKNSLIELFGKKTYSRLDEFCSTNNITTSDEWLFNDEQAISLETVIEYSNRYLPVNDGEWPITVLHGDFCFSNILYDFRANRIKTIDPRGMTYDGEMEIYGDVRYDLAKLSHSIVGLYDWIIAGYFEVEITSGKIHFKIESPEGLEIIQKRFMDLVSENFNITSKSLMAMQIQLFLSMLPLHSDDLTRQRALFANAFRIYHLMKEMK